MYNIYIYIYVYTCTTKNAESFVMMSLHLLKKNAGKVGIAMAGKKRTYPTGWDGERC